MQRSRKQSRFAYNIGTLLVLALSCTLSHAQSGPSAINISGGLFNPNGTAITASNVGFKLEILDQSGACVLYSEEHLAENLSQTKGAFSVQLGSGTSATNFLPGTTGFDRKLFVNSGVVPAFGLCLTGVTLAPGDGRLIRVSYNLGAGFIAMTPDVPIVATAYAMVADTVQGKGLTDLVQTNTSSAALSQANVEVIFSNVNFTKLTDLLNGTSTQYLPTTPTAPVNFNGQRIVNLLDPTGAQDAATKNYADSNLGGKTIDAAGVGLGVGGGKTLVWDQALNKWVAQTPNSYVGGVVAGSGLLGGTITSFGTLSVDVGTNANQIVQLTNLSYLPAVDGHLLTNIQFPVISVAGRTGAVTLNAADIGGLGTAAVKDYGTVAGNLVELAGASLLPALDGSLLTNINATLLQSRAVANVAPAAGQILAWNSSASQWEPQNATIAGITDLTGDVTATGPGSAVATISANAVTSGKINNSGNVVNRLLITDATTGATVTYATCLQGEVMKYDITTGWGCAADVGAGGIVTAVMAGTGMVAGTITSTGTLNVDVGTTAGKILQLNGSAQIPAVDGGIIANINAVRLQGRDLASAAPVSGQVIGWTGSQWEPISVTSGTLTEIVASTGLLGGTINSNGTLSVDVGVTGNKIVQLTAGAQYPAVDGNLISNVNAVKIQGRDVAATAPGANQVLGWNAGASQWEPLSAATGSVTNVVSGSGLVAGNISSFGTINVDVGVTANKILQLDSNAQIPAVDGFLVTNINAVKLQNRDLANTAPISGQVIGWTGSQWEPISVTSGTLTEIVASTGLLGGTINSNGTVSVDVGVTGSKIVQLTPGAQYPAVDGNLISNVNAVNLQTRSVAATAPGDGQVLTWNNGTSVWEPKAPGAGADNLGNHTASQDLAMTNFSITGLNLGTVGAPSLSFSGDATTGVYSPGASVVAVATAGAERLRVTANGIRLAPAALPGAPAAGDIAIDSGAANTLRYYNGSAWVSSSGTMTGVVSGTGLIAGTISSYGTLNIDVGVAANQIIQLTPGAQYPAVDGNLISNVNAVKIQGREIASTAPSASQVLGWNAGTSQWEPLSAAVGSVTNVISGTGLVAGNISSYGTINVDVGVTANKILQLDSNAQIPAVDGYLVTNINAVKLQNRDLASSAPASGQVIGWTGSQWEPISVTSGTLTQIVASTGLLGGTINSNGTVSVDVGTTANQIVQLTPGAQYPAVDGNLISNVNAVKIQGRDIASTAPSASQVLGWNAGASQWEPLSAAVGSVTNVISGAGLVAGNISSLGTINVDVGVTANKILQLDSNAQIPAVDGYLVTNINAVKLQSRDLASTAPASGQVIGWTGSQWEPISITSGTLTEIVASTGLLGGTINTNGTVSVDVGVSANKILQLDSNAQIPAVDGFLVTNVNAVKLQSRPIASAAPVANYVLTWNGSQWEPQAPTNTFGSLSSMGNGNNAYTPSSGALSYPGSGGSTNAWVSLYNTASNDGYFAMSLYHVKNSAGNAQFSYITSSSVNGGSSYSPVMAFGRSTANNAYTESMRIDENGRIGIGTSAPASGAILDVNGTGAIGSAMVVPRDTTALRPTAGVNGMIRYNTSTSKMEFYQSGAWINATPQAFGDLAGGFVDGVGLNLAITPDRTSNFNSSNQNNVAFGYGALKSNTGNSDGNTAIGMNSLKGVVSTGGSNTGLGTRSGEAITTGDFNIVIGVTSGATITTEDNNIVIGHNADIPAAGTSSFLNIGDVLFSNMTLKTVGVGTNSPQAALDIYGVGPLRSAMIVPRDSTANKPAGVNGMIRYNTSTSRLEGFENGQWGNISASTSGTATQWTTSGSDITYNLGRVGIGTTSPTLSGLGNVLHIHESSGNASAIHFTNNDTGAAATDGATIGLDPSEQLTFAQHGAQPIILATSGTDRLHITGSGDVGIGTTTPTSKLHGVAALTAATGDEVAYRLDYSTNKATSGNDTGLLINMTDALSPGTSLPLDINVGGSSKFSVDNVGNVEAGGSGDFGGGLFTHGTVNTVYAASGAGTGPYQGANSGSSLHINNYSSADSVASLVQYYVKNTSGVVQNSYMGAVSTPGAGVYSPSLVFGQQSGLNTWNERMRIDSSGNVGIGTTAPMANTRLEVNGQIRTPVASIATGSVDFSVGNSVVTSYNCAGNITLANIREGGSYTVIVTDPGTTKCDFSTTTTGDDAATVAYRFQPPNAVRTVSTHTIYSLFRAANIVYVSWITGF